MKYSETVTDLEQQLFSLHPKAKELYTLISGLKAVDQPNEPFVYNVNFHNYVVHNLGHYMKTQTVAWKIIYALHNLQRLSKVNDIMHLIQNHEPSFSKGLNTPLTKLKVEGLINTYNSTGSNKDVYYGLFNWFDEDGIIKKEFDISAIKNRFA